MKTFKYAISLTYIDSNFEIVEDYSCVKLTEDEVANFENDVREKIEADIEAALEEGHETIYANARVIPIAKPLDAYSITWRAEQPEGEEFEVNPALH